MDTDSPRVTGPAACMVCDGYAWIWLPRLGSTCVRVYCLTCDGTGKKRTSDGNN